MTIKPWLVSSLIIILIAGICFLVFNPGLSYHGMSKEYADMENKRSALIYAGLEAPNSLEECDSVSKKLENMTNVTYCSPTDQFGPGEYICLMGDLSYAENMVHCVTNLAIKKNDTALCDDSLLKDILSKRALDNLSSEYIYIRCQSIIKNMH